MYDRRPSHAYKAGTEHIGFFPGRADIACTKLRQVFGKSHEGWVISYQDPLLRPNPASCAYFFRERRTGSNEVFAMGGGGLMHCLP